jgi:hypothetical protein
MRKDVGVPRSPSEGLEFFRQSLKRDASDHAVRQWSADGVDWAAETMLFGSPPLMQVFDCGIFAAQYSCGQRKYVEREAAPTAASWDTPFRPPPAGEKR